MRLGAGGTLGCMGEMSYDLGLFVVYVHVCGVCMGGTGMCAEKEGIRNRKGKMNMCGEEWDKLKNMCAYCCEGYGQRLQGLGAEAVEALCSEH